MFMTLFSPRRFVQVLAAYFLTILSASAQEASAGSQSVAEIINEKFKPIAETVNEVIFYKIKFSETLQIDLVLLILAFTAVFLTVRFKFINIFGLKRSFLTLSGRYSEDDDPGEITHFQALTAALSATVGLGNIAGVAIAISIGGPGATFWMIVVGFLGMTTKCCECILGLRYRQIDSDGRAAGGAMYYLSGGFKELGYAGIGKVLAVIFAIACVFGSFGAGNMFQGNQAMEQMINVTGGADSVFNEYKAVVGAVIAVLVGLVIIGGVKSIGRVTEKLVPIMCAIYVAGALYIIFSHFSEIPGAFKTIFEGAFSSEGAFGGFVGIMIQGIKRASFSNEAGFGSAPIAHSAVKTKKPASEGYVALLEPFVDTVIVCTMTALVIIITGNYVDNAADASWGDAVTVTSTAFGSVISWFPYVLFAAVMMFAFSTMISWSYYGLTAWMYLFGKSKISENSYKVLFCLLVIVGTSANTANVIAFSDAMVFAMCFPNFIAIYAFLPKIKEELDIYDDHVRAVEARLK